MQKDRRIYNRKCWGKNYTIHAKKYRLRKRKESKENNHSFANADPVTYDATQNDIDGTPLLLPSNFTNCDSLSTKTDNVPESYLAGVVPWLKNMRKYKGTCARYMHGALYCELYEGYHCINTSDNKKVTLSITRHDGVQTKVKIGTAKAQDDLLGAIVDLGAEMQHSSQKRVTVGDYGKTKVICTLLAQTGSHR
jgi:hypothetical protein